VKLEGGKLTIQDHASGQQVFLPALRGL
jgi:hypothetical protein